MNTRNLKISFDSLKGMRRDRNKDGVLIVKGESYKLFGIFDGVSSSLYSHKAVKKAISFVDKNHKNYYGNEDFQLSKLVFDLNNLLINCGIEEPFTTCCMMYVPNDLKINIKFVNIGDSRIYAVTRQFIDKLTIDDSDIFQKNILLKYLGKNDLNRNVFKENHYDGVAKRFLLCSDGFYNIFEGNNKALLEMHHSLNINHSFYIKYNISKVISGQNFDDATYILVRCQDV